MSSFERILPFVRPIEHLLLDPDVTEVMVNCGGRRVFVERAGRLQEVSDLVLDERNLKVAIKTSRAPAATRFPTCNRSSMHASRTAPVQDSSQSDTLAVRWRSPRS